MSNNRYNRKIDPENFEEAFLGESRSPYMTSALRTSNPSSPSTSSRRWCMATTRGRAV
ncbi:hypothetical protein ACFPFV_08125 [Salinicoccus siamensis]|uniref:hypothetical protein n=1 Tax=Salinicoccus siamensis TaxID=381830 RepID=UPI0036199FFE